MARNWERREAISRGLKPAVRRRSKPRGAGVVVASLWGCDCVLELSCGVDDEARAASAARSAGERGSEMEQWM